jgi:hypothetical protein
MFDTYLLWGFQAHLALIKLVLQISPKTIKTLNRKLSFVINKSYFKKIHFFQVNLLDNLSI